MVGADGRGACSRPSRVRGRKRVHEGALTEGDVPRPSQRAHSLEVPYEPNSPFGTDRANEVSGQDRFSGMTPSNLPGPPQRSYSQASAFLDIQDRGLAGTQSVPR